MTCDRTRRLDVYGTLAANVADVLARTVTLGPGMSDREILVRELMAEGRLDRSILHRTPESSAAPIPSSQPSRLR